MNSNFKNDIQNETAFKTILEKYDPHFQNAIKNNTYQWFDFATNKNIQFSGIDFQLDDKTYDLKARIKYDNLNRATQSFNFEVSYVKDYLKKEGWVYETKAQYWFIVYDIMTKNQTNTITHANQITSFKVAILNVEKFHKYLTFRHLDFNAVKQIENNLRAYALQPDTILPWRYDTEAAYSVIDRQNKHAMIKYWQPENRAQKDTKRWDNWVDCVVLTLSFAEKPVNICVKRAVIEGLADETYTIFNYDNI